MFSYCKVSFQVRVVLTRLYTIFLAVSAELPPYYSFTILSCLKQAHSPILILSIGLSDHVSPKCCCLFFLPKQTTEIVLLHPFLPSYPIILWACLLQWSYFVLQKCCWSMAAILLIYCVC